MRGEADAAQAATTQEYASPLACEGGAIFPGSGRAFCQKAGMHSLVRRPDFCPDVPPAREIRDNLRRALVPVATYVRKPRRPAPSERLALRL